MSRAKIKFNGMDVFIIAVLALVIAAGAYILFGTGAEVVSTSAENAEVTATVELASQNKDFADNVAVGDVVFVGEKEKAKAVVSKVEAVPAKATGYDILEGRVIRAEIPEMYDVKITFSGNGTESDSTIALDGSAIRVGQSVVLGSKNWAGKGYVIGLETENAQ